MLPRVSNAQIRAGGIAREQGLSGELWYLLSPFKSQAANAQTNRGEVLSGIFQALGEVLTQALIAPPCQSLVCIFLIPVHQ